MNSTTQMAAPATAKAGLLINRNFALLWTGQSLSIFGDMIFDMTLLVWVAVLTRGQPWSPLAISGLLVAAALPPLLIGPIAGVFVDRWEKRHAMLYMDVLRAALVGLLMLSASLLSLPLTIQLGALFSIVFLVSACSQFFMPSRFALIGDIVEDARRPKAAGLMQVTQSIAMLLAPAAAPPLFLFAGVEWALGINALSFLASFALILAIRPPQAARSAAPGQQGNFLREFREGWRFAMGNRVTSTLLLSILVIMLGVSTVNALDILFALQRLHAPLNLYGLLATMMGVGMLGGAILAGTFAKRIGLVRLLMFSLLLGGLSLVAYSRMTSFVPALPVMFCFGVVQAGVSIAFGPLLLRVTPRELIGRVRSVIDPSIAVVTLLGTALSGYLAGVVLQGFHAAALGLTFGPLDTIFTVGGLLSIFGAAYAAIRLGFTDPPAQAAPSSAPASAVEMASEVAAEASVVAVPGIGE